MTWPRKPIFSPFSSSIQAFFQFIFFSAVFNIEKTNWTDWHVPKIVWGWGYLKYTWLYLYANHCFLVLLIAFLGIAFFSCFLQDHLYGLGVLNSLLGWLWERFVLLRKRMFCLRSDKGVRGVYCERTEIGFVITDIWNVILPSQNSNARYLWLDFD